MTGVPHILAPPGYSLGGRPLLGLGPDLDPLVSDWQARVVANGGSVSSSTLNAVGDFVRGCQADGLWSRLQRVNLMAGDQLAAAQVPLILGPGSTLVSSTLNNGGFETAGAGGADAFALWSESVAGTSTVNRDTSDFDTGSASCRFDIDASASSASVMNSTLLTVGVTYSYTIRAKASIAGTTVRVGDGVAANSNNHPLTTSWATYTGSFTATTTTFSLARHSASLGSRSIWVDSATLTNAAFPTDVSFNFVGGDYTPATGLTGNGNSKYLSTGLVPNLETGHMSAYLRTAIASGATVVYMGCRISDSSQVYRLGQTASGSHVAWGAASTANIAGGTPAGLSTGSRTTTSSNGLTLYRNGAVAATSSNAVTPLGSGLPAFVFAQNAAGSPTTYYGGSMGGYSIGDALNATEQLALYNRMQAFNAALGRSV
jgi:hypothetical protein